MGKTAQHFRLGLLHDSDFAGALKTQNRPWGEFYVPLEVEHSVARAWMCKKQTSVSHSSTESEVISSDAGLRMDGIPALDLWDLVIEVRKTCAAMSNQENAPTPERRNTSTGTISN